MVTPDDDSGVTLVEAIPKPVFRSLAGDRRSVENQRDDFAAHYGRMPSTGELYLIHQQGIEGAAEHVSHPNRLAWRSMCATDEGKEKGEKWCKRAIWGNTLPAIKRVWKNVNKVTSAAFVGMWQQRVSHFYARYSDAAAN